MEDCAKVGEGVGGGGDGDVGCVGYLGLGRLVGGFHRVVRRVCPFGFGWGAVVLMMWYLGRLGLTYDTDSNRTHTRDV